MSRAQVSCPRAWDVCIPFIDFCQASLIQVCLFLFSSRHTYRYLVQPKNHLLGLGYSSVEEYLPNICKALGLIPYSGNGAWRGVMSSYLKDNKAKRTIFFLYLVFVFKTLFFFVAEEWYCYGNYKVWSVRLSHRHCSKRWTEASKASGEQGGHAQLLAAEPGHTAVEGSSHPPKAFAIFVSPI